MKIEDEKIEAEVLKSDNSVTIADEKDEVKEEVNTKLDNTSEESVSKKDDNNTNNDNDKNDEFKAGEERRYNNYKRKVEKDKKRKHTFLILAIIIFILLVIGIAFSTVFALVNANNNKILSGITIRNTKVEGLTEQEAIEALTNDLEQEKKKNVVVKINGETFEINQEQIQVEYNVEKTVEEAYRIGRDGNIIQNNFNILKTMFEENHFDVEMKYNEEELERVLNDIEAKLPNVMVDNTYDIEDNELIITRGTDGIAIDMDDAKQSIIQAIENGNNEEVIVGTVLKECPEIDIDKIYSEVKSEPQNASYIKEPFQIIPHKTGTDFDLEAAKEMLKEDKEEYVIKLDVIEPEIHTNEIGEEAFPDLLGAFSTKYDETNVSRSKNLKIAMNKLNGVVVMPGEVFSYNTTLGKRTVEEGYQYANGFSGGGVVPMLGGGICQISSTLYNAVLYANLNIVERHNHMYQATYVDPGRDATVSYGTLDFKFENTRKYPIMIKTQCGSGTANIKIFGIKEDIEYEVDIISNVSGYVGYKVVYQDDASLSPGAERVSQYGLQGCKSTTYRVRKLNGQEVSREVLSTDSYSALNKIIRRGVASSRQKATTTEKTEAQQPQTNATQETQKVEETPKQIVDQPKQETPEPVTEEKPKQTTESQEDPAA